MLKTWLSICTKEHCATCQPDVVPREVGLALKVIDVTRCCIIFAPSNCRYLALSYVWRDISQLELTEDTQHRLMEDNGLSTTEQQSRRVPKSIWDAIELTRQLGERYLWVDALCIKQDDEADKRLLINNMDVIYSSAIFTIVAAAGKDADAGLPGLHLDSSRPVLDAIENIQGLNLGIARRPFVDSITESTWEERGWTFQEKILSKRLMIFTDEQVFFHCNEATWFEDTILEKHDPDIQIQTPWYGHREWVKPRSNTSKFDKYGGLLDGYLHRDLTYESDILNAFQGILNALTPLFEGGFFWGLPTCLFDAALLWRTSHSLKSRRPNFPSWSWLGWKQYSIGYSELLHKSTASEIDWFQASSSCGDGDGIDQIIRIPNSESLRYETRRQGCSNSNTSPGEEELCTQWKKRHDSKKISTAENYIHTTIHPPPSHLLFFWTSSAILPVDHLNPKPTNSPNSTPHNHTYSILAPHPTTSTNIAKITLDPNWRETQPDTLEFIVISRDIRPNYLQRKENPPQQRQQRLNIMLIKYQTEGIASRVQLPQDSVLEAQWNELPNLKWKFVVLG
ncbi:MAG: hypothetical protein M1834_007623 [Cirrosporium novae-zelandiae]|nr:MAG: hypothetical protein M1834_007623 [Cirrosporium novae-zelandiae]